MLVGRSLRITAAVGALGIAFAAGAGTIALIDRPSTPTVPTRTERVIQQAVNTIEAHAAKPVSKAALQRAAVQGMLSRIGDKWASYYGKTAYQRFRSVLSGSYTGVGVWVRRDQRGSMRVLSVQPHSSASRAGVRRGDRIIAVAGKAVGDRPAAAVTDALKGKAGSSVAVTVAANDGQVTSMSLRRTGVASDDVSTSMLTPTVERIRVAAFTAGVGQRVQSLVAAATRDHVTGLVLDLRDDPGGLLDEAVETASAFLAGGPVVTYVQRGQPPHTLDAVGSGNATIPLVVLIDGGTASAAEIVASALQDRGRAVLLGSQSFGKGTVQAPEHLAGGGALELTVGHYLTASGTSLEGKGITPDVLIPAKTPESVFNARVLEVLSGLTARQS